MIVSIIHSHLLFKHLYEPQAALLALLKHSFELNPLQFHSANQIVVIITLLLLPSTSVFYVDHAWPRFVLQSFHMH